MITGPELIQKIYSVYEEVYGGSFRFLIRTDLLINLLSFIILCIILTWSYVDRKKTKKIE